ncbi:MAG: glycosyltransferase [Parvibaculum sp.]|nr:glycosyltransferase [Parvibaculum sp.]
MSFRVCALLPTYKHITVLEHLVVRLRGMGLDVIVVDDGNGSDIANEIAAICSRHEGVFLHRRDVNGGKGAAVLDGLRLAASRGFTHALQMDADGQHDITCVPSLVECAKETPDALVTGVPVFDDSIPRGRLIGRWITHIWVSINTLSPRIIDTMCGFRVYPLAPTLAVADSALLSLRMGFDTEIVVRLIWRGVEVKTVPVKVIYPEGNHSNFALKENVGMSVMHARLLLGMLLRAPRMMWHRMRGEKNTETHWARLGERGSALGLLLLAQVFRFFGRYVCLAAMSPVIVFFFLTGRVQRRASMDYLNRLWLSGGLPKQPGYLMSLRHFFSFGTSALDKLAAWTGNIPLSDIDGANPSIFDVVRESGRGAFMLTAHLGNPEVIRAVGSLRKRSRVNVLVHTANAVKFNAMIEANAQGSTLRMIEVTTVGPDTAILLQEAIANGEIVVIVGDRIPVTGNARISWAKFLGAPAPFAQGPHILASILKCPVYLLFCVRTGARHKIYYELFSDRLELPRKEREAALQASVQRYAERLEHYVRLAPLQWFNFYDYWRPNGLEARRIEISGDREGKAAR